MLAACGLALLPWLGYLAGILPPAEAAAWVALDALEAAALLTAGTRLLRADPRHRAPAAAAAVLLLADACLDLATAAPGPELAAAVAMAVAGTRRRSVRQSVDPPGGDRPRPAMIRWPCPPSPLRSPQGAVVTAQPPGRTTNPPVAASP